MELVFLALLIVLMATALGSGFPVAFSLPGSAIIAIGAAALCGWMFAGDVNAYFAQGGPVEWLTAGVTNFRGIYWEVERDTLIAIPLFVFMGIMLQRSRIAEDLLVTMAQLFGPIPGGLGISVVFVGALLAATTGIVGATVVAMGLISLPVMMRHKYSPALATGTIAASGTLGQIIPPSIVLIILADQLASAVDQASAGRKSLYKEVTGQFSMPSSFDAVSTSAGDMFMGAFVPGLVLVAAYMIFILIVAIMRPKLAPAVHFEGKYDARFALRVVMILVPPLTLIFVVLGSIILGIATVNQAGAIGAVGATIMAGVRLHGDKRGALRPALLAIVSIGVLVVIADVSPINVKNIQTTGDVVALVVASFATLAFLVSLAWAGWRTYKIDNTMTSVMVETAKTSSLVFIILLGAAMLTAAFRAFGGEELVREALTSLPGGFWTQFVIVMAVIFVLGFFLDFIEIAVVVVPIVAPILLADPGANVTAVWLGVMIGLNIQTSFLTPPFGFALFYLRGVASAAVKTVQMYKGVVAFILLQLLALAIVAVNPSLVNYLPNRIWLTAETAPPPLNPRLQQCLEDYTFVQYQARGDDLRAAISLARELDLSYLPEKLQKDTAASFDKAQRTFELVDEVRTATAAVDAATPEYRPLHVQVRTIQRDLRRLDARTKAHEQQIERLKRDEPDVALARIGALEAEISALQSEHDALRLQVPARWEAEHKAFRNLQASEDKARKTYRRNIDEAYLPVRQLRDIVADAEALAGLEGDLVALRADVPDTEPARVVDKLAEIAKAVGSVAGAKAIRTDLSAARRALRAKQPDVDKALDKFDSAIKKYRAELAWRQRAASELLPGVERYEASIRDTIGLRQQPRMPREQALELVSCTAEHRDISLHF
ncbi:MAG: TRAP transporter large permease subunit [Gammaproteobacteria bacterium]|nr:TRAP transporter large permease subunit [Gammaproteobacteria bacterium]